MNADTGLKSGISWHGMNRKVVALANAAHAFESQFGVEINVQECLQGIGPFTISYWENGDDDGAVMTFNNSGDQYFFDEEEVLWSPVGERNFFNLI